LSSPSIHDRQAADLSLRASSGSRFTQRHIQDLSRAREATGRWTFVYLGADQDVWAASAMMGVQPGNAAPFEARKVGAAFDAAAEATRSYRMSGKPASRDFWRKRRPSTGPSAPR
jgi:hypothetical protein